MGCVAFFSRFVDLAATEPQVERHDVIVVILIKFQQADPILGIAIADANLRAIFELLVGLAINPRVDEWSQNAWIVIGLFYPPHETTRDMFFK